MQDLGEHGARNGDLGHLEGNIAAVTDELRAGLDQLLLEVGQRPVLDRFRRCQCSQEVAKIVGERMKLKPNGVGRERPARQPRPADRTLAFLDPLLGRAALIVECDNPFCRARQIGDDEADAGIKLAWMPVPVGNLIS